MEIESTSREPSLPSNLPEANEDIPSNTRRDIRTILRSYPVKLPHIIQNEIVQNVLDAYDNPTNPERVEDVDVLEIDILLDADNGILKVRDNAGGMEPEEVKDAWFKLHDGAKNPGMDNNRGSEGQGTSVYMGVSNYVFLETICLGERWTGFYDRKSHKRRTDNPLDDFRHLDQNGTYFEIHGLDETWQLDYTGKKYEEKQWETLQNVEEMHRIIQRRWHHILKRDNVVIRYGTEETGLQEVEPVNLGEPEQVLTDKEPHELTDKVNEDKGTTINRMEFYTFEDENDRPKPFSNAMYISCYDQIKYYRTPMNVREHGRILVFVEAKGLTEVEDSTHMKFDNEDSLYTETYAAIKAKIQDFAREQFDAKTNMPEEERAKYNDTHRLLGELMSNTSSFNMEPMPDDEGHTGGEGDDEPETPYIEELNFGPQNPKPGQQMQVSVFVTNPIQHKRDCRVQFEVINHETNVPMNVYDDTHRMDATEEARMVPSSAHTIAAPPQEGRYKLRAKVTSKNETHTRTVGFRVGDVETETTCGGPENPGEGDGEGTSKSVLSGTFMGMKENLPPEERPLAVMLDQGKVTHNILHPAWLSSKGDDLAEEKQIIHNVVTVATQYTMDEKIEEFEEGDKTFEELKKDLARLMEENEEVLSRAMAHLQEKHGGGSGG